jgi:hypothetical protein
MLSAVGGSVQRRAASSRYGWGETALRVAASWVLRAALITTPTRTRSRDLVGKQRIKKQ